MTSPPDNTSPILLKLGEMGAQLAVIVEQLKAMPDHEQRIRALEKWRYGLPLTLLLAVTSIAVAAWSALK